LPGACNYLRSVRARKKRFPFGVSVAHSEYHGRLEKLLVSKKREELCRLAVGDDALRK